MSNTERTAGRDQDVILSILKLSRAMRRCPPEHREYPFPPAVGRLLGCVAENNGVSSRELCEFLDLRPSSLSEMLARAETDGLITRTADEGDRRVQHVSLSAKGRQIVAEMEAARAEDARKKASCLTEEEKEQFCALCGRLSEHIEGLALDLPEGMAPRRRGPRLDPEGRAVDPEAPLRRPPFGEGEGGETSPRAPEGRPPLPPGGRYRC